MGPILEQLELNSTTFIQLLIFSVLYFVLSTVYFKPFLKLIQKRQQKTLGDREEAERLLSQANARFQDYQQKLAEERLRFRAELEKVVAEAKKEENTILNHAREEAKRITLQTQEALAQQKAQLKSQLSGEAEALAQMVSEKLLSRKV